MNILICSDGTAAGESAVRLGGILAAGLHCETTLLGIAENPSDQSTLQAVLQKQAELQPQPRIVVQSGDVIAQILAQTTSVRYDLVVIGARPSPGAHWPSGKMYELVKTIESPVLVAMGDCKRLKRILICTGGKEFIEKAVQFTGKLAAALGASVTLLHVMLEPPSIYADLVRMEEDVPLLLESGSELGLNLAQQKKDLERLKVSASIRIRHGIVVDEVFAEFDEGDYDLIVTGSSRARGMLRHSIMGDLTRSILNRANCPVLVARGGKTAGPRGLFRTVRRWFSSNRE